MDAFQKVWLIILVPLILVYGYYVFIQGFRILKYKKYTLNFAEQVRIRLIRLFYGDEKALNYKDRLLSNPSEMKIKGIWAIIYGILSLIVAIICIIALIL